MTNPHIHQEMCINNTVIDLRTWVAIDPEKESDRVISILRVSTGDSVILVDISADQCQKMIANLEKHMTAISDLNAHLAFKKEQSAVLA